MGQTWPNVEDMRRGIALMRQGNPYFAWQLQNGVYRPCYQVEQLVRFESNIFEGVSTPGFYLIRPDNRTRLGALDFDNHDGRHSRDFWLPTAERAFTALAKRFPEAWLLESSPGGYHVIPFASELVDACEIRAILSEIAPKGVEVFPKQDMLKDDPRAKGSLLRFPGKHQCKGTWARFIARHGRIQDAEAIRPVSKSSKWTEPSADGRLQSLYVIATRGIAISGNGQRFHAMQKITGRLKGRANEADALWVYTAWHNRNADRIATPFEVSRDAFLACFRAYKPCNVEIPDYPLSAPEKALIAELPKMQCVKAELLAETVRLFFCSKKYANEQGRDLFMSLPFLARHLGVSVTTAWRYVEAVKGLDIVEVVKTGHTGWATTYRLLRP